MTKIHLIHGSLMAIALAIVIVAFIARIFGFGLIEMGVVFVAVVTTATSWRLSAGRAKMAPPVREARS